MRNLVRTMSIVQNVVKTLFNENPNKPQAIGTLGIDASGLYGALKCWLGLTGLIGLGVEGCGAGFFSRAVLGRSPPATRAAHLVNTFFVVDINVLRLRLATAESTA